MWSITPYDDCESAAPLPFYRLPPLEVSLRRVLPPGEHHDEDCLEVFQGFLGATAEIKDFPLELRLTLHPPGKEATTVAQSVEGVTSTPLGILTSLQSLRCHRPR